MKLSSLAIERPVLTWMLIMVCFAGGIWGMITIGKLEDPAFTVRIAIIHTAYPGATAEEVEVEVTEVLESAIQQLSQLKEVTSRSMPGRSEITVEILDHYPPSTIPQIWDELRNKINDAAGNLPGGIAEMTINDDFSDVFGIFYAVTTNGFTDRQVTELATFLRREILTVPGVARVETAGMPEEHIYVEVAQDRLASLGLPIEMVINTLQTENRVAPAGSVLLGDHRIRVVSPPGLDSVAAIENLRLGRPGSTEQVSVFDVATVSRELAETPAHLIRHQGEAAFTVAVSGLDDLNIIEVGRAVDRHLDALQERMPLGVTLHPVYQQHVVVDEAISNFIISLMQSVAIVVGVLCLAMGWRVGLVVGLTLLLTVLGSVFFMRIFSIEMERISLGALIIAMGMLVDNAIVVAEGMLMNMQRGQDAKTASAEATRRTQIPLLGATVIGILAFAGIGLSSDVTGEFLFSLFAVIAMSLLLSWLLAVTVTPLFGHYLFKNMPARSEDELYGSWVYRWYQGVLTAALRCRWLTVMALVGLTVVSVMGFGQVRQAFFPASNTPIFYINYFLPQGSDIQATNRDIGEIESYLLEQPEVVAATSFVGRGASRFMLTYAPEQPNPAFGHFIVRTHDRDQIPALMRRLREDLIPRYPDAQIYTNQLMFGPSDGAKIEARFSGPDGAVLRDLAAEAMDLMRSTPGIMDVRQDWREREIVIQPRFNEERARVAGVTRTDLAATLEFATSGSRSGAYREADRQIPIILRPPEEERLDMNRLQDWLVWSGSQQTYVPMIQMVDGFETVHQEAMIYRRDRVRTITVGADPEIGLTADEGLRRIRQAVESIDLPPGYRFEWGGEYKDSTEAQESLGEKLPLTFLMMLGTSILLFNALRQPLVVWSVVPMSICGVTAGLLLTDMPFSFTALLGLLSLSGMLMKNAIVLVDEIDLQIHEGGERATAIVRASISRLRPVMMAALTTILGMLPLLWDAFFNSMAVTIMGGLAFASVLTLVAVPVIYALVFRIRATENSGGREARAASSSSV